MPPMPGALLAAAMILLSDTPGTRISAAWQILCSEPLRLAWGRWPDVTSGRLSGFHGDMRQYSLAGAAEKQPVLTDTVWTV